MIILFQLGMLQNEFAWHVLRNRQRSGVSILEKRPQQEGGEVCVGLLADVILRRKKGELKKRPNF